MFSQYPLFQSHLDLAHQHWQKLVKAGDLVIDATCGNGHDTVFLAQLDAKVIAMDIQPEALEKTKIYLNEILLETQKNNVQLIHGCHSSFPAWIEAESVKLIVYNLGYLPGGNKEATTKTATTLASLSEAQRLLLPGGVFSITCYPGHPEGALEEEALLSLASTLSPKEWSCCHHRWVNRRSSPSLLLIQKSY